MSARRALLLLESNVSSCRIHLVGFVTLGGRPPRCHCKLYRLYFSAQLPVDSISYLVYGAKQATASVAGDGRASGEQYQCGDRPRRGRAAAHN